MEESKVKDLTAYKNRFEEDASSFSEFQARDFVKELKDQGKTDEAIEVGRTFLEMAPELKGYINYFGYALYNKYINISDEEISKNESLFYGILEEIAKYCKQERYSPLEAAVNKAIKHVLKANPVDYKKLSELLDYLDAPTLEDKPFVNKDGKEFESKKEKWYRMKVRALYELESYRACVETANIAFTYNLKWHYNNLNWVKYYRASSLVELGRYEEAENEFIALQGHFNAVDSFEILYKLYMNTNREDDAYTLLVDKFFKGGFDYKNIEDYKKISAMAKAKGQDKAHALAECLIKKLEEENGNAYEADVDLADYADLSASDAFDRVYSEVIYHLENYITRHEGKVVFYNHDKSFGSIFQDGEENLFFRQADFLDDEEVEKYDVVEYSVIKTYDRKRQQMSSKAVLLKVLYEEINY
ncbi:hypothetical protein [uncultured Catenibacterium sp.]|uniref:hypothetical protein n=1 Tax=uncultured Catenibacterium sp. TaxID=286142 RepID=UPI0025D3D98A|nr:hypothetical protein [uncultured Catenibacterium sp.]